MQKIVIFAHSPPPHHGQSVMVEQLVSALVQDPDFDVYHVNARFSADMAAVGSVSIQKVLLALGYCVQALYFRFVHRVNTFYYVPAPPKRAALYRDWIVLALCRPFFKHVVLHWHAVGLGEWLLSPAKRKRQSWRVRMEAKVTAWLAGGAECAIVLNAWSITDAKYFFPKAISVVPNGIPEPCAAIEAIIAEREQRLRARREQGEQASPIMIKALFMGHCTREKGVFDAIDAVVLANQYLLEQSSCIQFQLSIAGAFIDNDERALLFAQIERENKAWKMRMERNRCGDLIKYLGFLAGDAKADAFHVHDVLCFPSYYPYEASPIIVVEALAYAMPVVTTRWRALPDMIAGSGLPVAPIQSPEELARAMIAIVDYADFFGLRRLFATKYTLCKFTLGITQALQSID